jgi:hypothetical protein
MSKIASHFQVKCPHGLPPPARSRKTGDFLLLEMFSRPPSSPSLAVLTRPIEIILVSPTSLPTEGRGGE